VGKRKKPKKKKPYPSSLLSQEQETQLTALLENLKNISPSNIDEQIPSPELAQAFVDRLPPDDPEVIHILLAVREAFPQKNVQKAIKKTIFRFKQRGLSHHDLEPDKGPAILVRKAEQIEPSAYLGPVDGSGSRGVFLTLPQVPKGVDLGMGAVSDEQGILQFLYGRYSKKRMKEVKDLFFSNFQYAVETSLSHTATVLERAYQKSGQSLGQQARDYLKLRPWILENVSLLSRSVIYDFIPPGSSSKESLTASQIDKLLGHELMKTWIIHPEKMNALMEEIQNVKESRILVSEAQKTERINELKRKAITEIYSEEKRPLLKWRLEEMAYIFFKLDEEEMVHLSLAAAQSIDEKDSPLLVNPFLEAMMERTLAYYLKAAREMDKSKEAAHHSSSRIIIP
jgi:hypothetical protein